MDLGEQCPNSVVSFVPDLVIDMLLSGWARILSTNLYCTGKLRCISHSETYSVSFDCFLSDDCIQSLEGEQSAEAQ